MLFYSSPTPEKAKSKKRKQAPADDSKAVPEESAAPPEAADAHEQVDADDAFHAAAASLFRDWLTQHKAQLAEEEEVSPYNPSTLFRYFCHSQLGGTSFGGWKGPTQVSGTFNEREKSYSFRHKGDRTRSPYPNHYCLARVPSQNGC